MEVWGSIYDVSWYNYTTAFVATISNNCRGAVRRRPISEKSHLDHNLVIITERYFFSDNKVFVARIWRDRDECTARENYLNHIEYRGTRRECLERVYTGKLQVSTLVTVKKKGFDPQSTPGSCQLPGVLCDSGQWIAAPQR